MTYYNQDNAHNSMNYSLDEYQNNHHYEQHQENHPLVVLYNQILNDFELNLNIKFEDNLKYLLYNNLTAYYNTNLLNVLEEKEEIIKQLKQSVVDLTDKRLRALNSTANGQLPSSSASLPHLNQHNIEFLINEKEKQIQDLKNDIKDNDNEIKKLKQTIKEQDDVILQLNNNIYELKNNNETVLRAKQDSFRLMNDEAMRKQKQIDDQNTVISSLKEKIEYLEEDYSRSRQELEKRLNEKDNELRIKIASFEANLYQGKQYFEEVLNEKNKALKDKIDEVNSLKRKLNQTTTNDDQNNDDDDEEESHDDSIIIEPKSSSSSLNDTSASASFVKFESETVKNMKSLYEHQIDILKVKIEMLEKTCLNYQKGIKEMNSSFGYKQQNDEMVSIQVFKEIMQDTQKKNAQLETECVELQVKVNRYKKELEEISIEKDNLNKKLFNLDNQLNRLLSEKSEFELYHKKQIDLKTNEINQLASDLNLTRDENIKLLNENVYLNQISQEHDELKVQHSQLITHYEQLYQHSSDIVNGNNMLNDENQSFKLTIEDLQNKLSDLNIKLDQLEWSNSDLNTKKINLDLKCADLEERMVDFESNLVELDKLRKLKLEYEDLKQRFEDLKAELNEKNELIDQLNQAKEFLAENNSKLLTNNIKIQLFLESLGLENHQSLIETNLHVKEFDDIKEQLNNVSIELNEFKFKFKQAELNIIEKDNELSKLNILLNKLNSKLDAYTQTETEISERQVLEVLEKEKETTASLKEENHIISKETEESIDREKFDPTNATEYQELAAKCQKLEEQNIKYKAKLKQLLNSNKSATASIISNPETSKENSQSQTDLGQADLDNVFKKCTELEQELFNKVQEFETKTDDLVNFGAELGCEKLKEHTLNELSDLSQYVNQTLSQLKTLQNDYDNLLNDKNQVENRLNNVIESLNNDLNEKIKLIDDLKEINSNEDTTNLFNLKIENSNLIYQSENLKSKLIELESAKSTNNKQIDEMKFEISNLNNEIKSKLEQISQLEIDNLTIQGENKNNLQELEKLKIKLSEFEENRSLNDQQELINHLKDQNLNLQSQLEQMKARIFNLETNEQELVNLRLEVEKLNELIQDKHQQIHQLETDYSILLNENQYNLELLDNMRKNTSNQLEQNDQSEKLDIENKLQVMNNKLLETDNKEKENLLEIENLKVAIIDLNNLIQNKQDQIGQLETDNLLFQNENESLKSRLDNLESNELVLNNEKQLVQTQLDNLKLLFNQENDDLRVEISNLNNLIEKKIERINELENDLSQVRESCSSNEYSDLKGKISQLENQNLKYKAKLKQLLNTSNKEKLETENIQKSSAQILTTSVINQDEEQLIKLQDENANLVHQLDELRFNIARLEQEKSVLENQLGLLKQEQESSLNDNISKENEFNKMKEENENLANKLTSMEQMNLKYKAKLKQVLKQQQQQQPQHSSNQLHVSLLEEQRSTNSTPTPPFIISPNPTVQTETVETQTIINHMNDSINDSTNNSSQIDHDELEKLKQQNLKLKAKVKQLLSANNLKQPSTDSIDSSMVDCYLKQIEELKSQISTLKSVEADLVNERTIIKNEQSELSLRLNEMELNELKTNETIENLNKEISNLSNQNQSSSSIINDYVNQIDNLTVQIEHLKSIEQDLTNDKSNLQNKLDELNTKLIESVETNNNFKDELKNSENYQLEIFNLTNELNILKSNEQEYNNQIVNLKQSFQIELNNLNELIETKSIELFAKLDNKETKIVQLNIKLQELEQQQENQRQFQHQHQTIHQEKEYENYITQNGSGCSSLSVDHQQQLTSIQSVDSSKYNHLEAQLKYCSEKCEKVVAKLNQLKSHNENLNNKIKSIKSMVIA